MGKANMTLVDKGIVDWTDVVTEGRVRDFREVVSLKKLDVKTLVKAGVPKRIAEDAFRSVHTAAHDLAEQGRQRILDAMKAKGLSNEQIKKAIAERLAARVSIGKGPSGPQPSMIKPSPLPLPTLAAALGVKITPPTPGPYQGALGLNFEPTLAAVEQKAATVVVDVAEFDSAWQRDEKYYIPPGGGSDKQKYLNAITFIQKAINEGVVVELPRTVVDEAGVVSFVDGRHRFAALRDLGATAVPVNVDRPTAKRAVRLYGAGKPTPVKASG